MQIHMKTKPHDHIKQTNVKSISEKIYPQPKTDHVSILSALASSASMFRLHEAAN